MTHFALETAVFVAVVFALLAVGLVLVGGLGMYVMHGAFREGGRLAAGERGPLAIGAAMLALNLLGLWLLANVLSWAGYI